jgi:hypothetical protein
MALEIATFSASVLDKVTPFCDIEHQQIGTFNKEMMNPIMLTLVSGSPAQ